jgi:hypothetical protein
MKSNTEIKRNNVIEVVVHHYKAGIRSLESIWRHYVYPIYPMSLRTFRRYIKLSEIQKLSNNK